MLKRSLSGVPQGVPTGVCGVASGRFAATLLNPAAPEASACSAAGIHWALEDLVASCLHHRQWREVQARSKLPPARPCLLLLAPSLLFPALHEVGVCHRLCAVSFSNFLCLFGVARLLVPAPSRLQVCSMPPPHEVGVCHWLCPVSFDNFL